MVLFLKGNSWIMKSMGKALMCGVMEKYMQENGKQIKCMEKEY
jgi:hypothetical protein